MNPFTGNVDAICPTCQQKIHSESVVGQTVDETRGFVAEVAGELHQEYPQMKIVVTDPVSRNA